MFDSFKQELGLLDNSESTEKKKQHPIVSYIDRPNENPQKEADKSIDLSMNLSKFKKSLSDPNLMFNDVESDEDA